MILQHCFYRLLFSGGTLFFTTSITVITHTDTINCFRCIVLLYTYTKYFDGNSDQVAHVYRTIGIFGEKNISSVTALDLFKCFKLIKQQRLLLACAPTSELPSYIRIMIYTKYKEEEGPILELSLWILIKKAYHCTAGNKKYISLSYLCIHKFT